MTYQHWFISSQLDLEESLAQLDDKYFSAKKATNRVLALRKTAAKNYTAHSKSKKLHLVNIPFSKTKKITKIKTPAHKNWVACLQPFYRVKSDQLTAHIIHGFILCDTIRNAIKNIHFLKIFWREDDHDILRVKYHGVNGRVRIICTSKV